MRGERGYLIPGTSHYVDHSSEPRTEDGGVSEDGSERIGWPHDLVIDGVHPGHRPEGGNSLMVEVQSPLSKPSGDGVGPAAAQPGDEQGIDRGGPVAGLIEPPRVQKAQTDRWSGGVERVISPGRGEDQDQDQD